VIHKTNCSSSKIIITISSQCAFNKKGTECNGGYAPEDPTTSVLNQFSRRSGAFSVGFPGGERICTETLRSTTSHSS
jgi:hypothetical protein